MNDKMPQIIAMLIVLILIYADNSGKLEQIQKVIAGPANPGQTKEPDNSDGSQDPSFESPGPTGSGQLPQLPIPTGPIG